MKPAPIPPNEHERLMSVHRLGILDTEPEERFDCLTREAAKKFNVPITAISILDDNREWYKSCQGLTEPEGDRHTSFCGHALLADQLFIVEDTLKDGRFADNPMVLGAPHIRFYAGVVLRDRSTNLPIGVFCIKDTKPRKLSMDETSALIDLAERAEGELNKG